MAVPGLQASVDPAALARDVVADCRLIHPSRVCVCLFPSIPEPLGLDDLLCLGSMSLQSHF